MFRVPQSFSCLRSSARVGQTIKHFLQSIPLRLQDANAPFILLGVLSVTMVHEYFVSGKGFLAAITLEGFRDLIFFGLLLLGLPVLGVLLPHMLIEVLSMLVGAGAVTTTMFVFVILILISQQELLVLLNVCLL